MRSYTSLKSVKWYDDDSEDGGGEDNSDGAF